MVSLEPSEGRKTSTDLTPFPQVSQVIRNGESSRTFNLVAWGTWIVNSGWISISKEGFIILGHISGHQCR